MIDLTPLDVRTALQRENADLPSGRLEGDLVELPVNYNSADCADG